MRRRTRAIALSRRRNRSRWLVLSLAALALAAFDAAEAAPAVETQPGSIPTVPEATPGPDHGTVKPPPAIGTSRSGGVLRPKGNPDPGIIVPTPNPKQFPTPVIKPPGTRGNNPQIMPK